MTASARRCAPDGGLDAQPRKAKAANKTTNAPTVMPGQAKETTPMTIASRPRHSRAEEMDGNIERPPQVSSFTLVALRNRLRRRREEGDEVGGDEDSADDGRGELLRAVAVTHVCDDGTTQQEQQPDAGEGADQRLDRAEEQADRPGHLEQADAAIGRGGEADLGGSLPHRFQGQDLGGAQADENQREQHRENGGRDTHDITSSRDWMA